jgi:hypothetical protein
VSLETRARSAAEGLRAATTIDPGAGLDRLRRTHRRRNAGRVAGVGVAAAIVLLLAEPHLPGGTANTEPAPIGQPSSTPTPSPSASNKPIDTKAWTTYTSDQYGFKVGHPQDWTELAATRDWSYARDITHWRGSAFDAFLSPAHDVLVSVWNAPLDAGTRIRTTADLEAWVGAYCKASGLGPCSGIHHRAVDLCLEARDCHPGLLMNFDANPEAFFSGGIYEPDAMTIVSVWRPEWHTSVAPYGGAQRLLEAFLSTMSVWPASTPFAERDCYGGPPAPTCESTG